MGMELTAEQRRSRLEREDAKLADAHLLDDIINHVSSGGSLIELCRLWDVRYHILNAWVYKYHKDAYEAALKSSGEFLIQRIRDELKLIGTVDIRKAYDSNGKLLAPQEMPDELAAVISAVEVEELYEGKGEDREQIGYLKKVKLWDKLKALELLGKTMAMFVERHDVTGKVTLEELVNGSMKPKENT